MTTINITIPTGKAGKLAVYTLEFSITNFDAVIEAAANVKTVNDLKNELWTVK